MLLRLFFFLFLLLYCLLYYLFLSHLFVAVSLNLKKDISDATGLILMVVQFLNDSIIRRGDFRELLIGFHIGHFIKFIDTISLLHIQFPHLSLFDLLSKIWEVEPQQGETGSLGLKERADLLKF